jgi:predicted alpha/beta superfamily hydrolase
MSRRIEVGGQSAWQHDEGWSYGDVHTFDALDVGGPPRKVHLLLPRDPPAGEGYPVVYMNDGQTALFPGGPGGQSWRVGEALSELRAAGRIEPVIVAAIHPVDRGREYTHAPWFPGQPYGGLPEYARYVAGPLKWFVEKNYPVDRARMRTMALGSSHGGLAAFYTAMTAPESFGLVGALSPSFWVGLGQHGGDIRAGLGSSSLMAIAAPVLSDRARRPRLWIDWGENGDGGRGGARLMSELLQRDYGYESGLDLHVHVDPLGRHDERAWGWRFRRVMERFYPASAAP